MCDCITDVEAKLKEHNTRLSLPFLISKDLNKMVVRTQVATEKIEPRKAPRRPMTAIASFCPFCGEKYQSSEKENSDERVTE